MTITITFTALDLIKVDVEKGLLTFYNFLYKQAQYKAVSLSVSLFVYGLPLFLMFAVMQYSRGTESTFTKQYHKAKQLS